MNLAAFAVEVLGKTYGSTFTVVSIGPGPHAIIEVRGKLHTISLEELRTLIERGLFTAVNH